MNQLIQRTLDGSPPEQTLLAQLANASSLDREITYAVAHESRWFLACQLANKHARPRTSWISQHGTYVVKLKGSEDKIGQLYRYLSGSWYADSTRWSLLGLQSVRRQGQIYSV